MKVDRTTGNVVRRSPEEFAAYKAEARRRWFDDQAMGAIHADYVSGTLPEAEYERAIEHYRNRDPSVVWTPPELERTEQAPPPLVAATGAAGDGRIVDFVDAIKVTATGERKNAVGNIGDVVTREYVLKFWNIGNLAPGYGHVEGKLTFTYSHHSAVKKQSCSGSFSGGPDGTFVVHCGKKEHRGNLVGGASVKLGKTTLNVKNPNAFNNWPPP